MQVTSWDAAFCSREIIAENGTKVTTFVTPRLLTEEPTTTRKTEKEIIEEGSRSTRRNRKMKNGGRGQTLKMELKFR
jgi:hypothetical protein